MNILSVSYPSPGLMTGRDESVITDLIIHHTAGPRDQTPQQIDQEHRARGMSMIGYNYVIDYHGNVYEGRPLQYVPAAAFGRNTESVNVVVTGNFESTDPNYTGFPSAAQVNALKELAVYLHAQLPHINRTIGHQDVATLFYPNDTADYATACPGDKLYALMPDIKAYIRENLHGSV